MTRQSPYAWPPRQSRAPQHAAVLRGNAVLRSRAHRAAKLFLITSVWVTGLFVVIAAVTMVAMATGPIASTSGSAALQKGLAGSGRLAGAAEAGDLSNGDHDQASDLQAGHGQAGHHQTGHIRAGESRTSSNPTRRGEALRRPATAGPSAPTRIHAVYAHTGSANTSPFTIGGDGTWKLAWAYNCTGFDPGGSFTVSQDAAGSVDGPYVTRLGTAGRGVTWAHQDAGTHYLVIRTQCQWRITVTSQP